MFPLLEAVWAKVVAAGVGLIMGVIAIVGAASWWRRKKDPEKGPAVNLADLVEPDRGSPVMDRAREDARKEAKAEEDAITEEIDRAKAQVRRKFQ